MFERMFRGASIVRPILHWWEDIHCVSVVKSSTAKRKKKRHDKEVNLVFVPPLLLIHNKVVGLLTSQINNVIDGK